MHPLPIDLRGHKHPALLLSICLVLSTDGSTDFTKAQGDDASPGSPIRGVQAPEWTQFEMNRKETDGSFLWTTPENWTRGVPRAGLCVEIGDDHSGKALHCVIPAGTSAVCDHLELAEHARTQGTTLHLQAGATLTILESGILSKDRESWFHVDGTLRCLKAGSDLRAGGPWGRPDIGEPASCHLVIGPTGVVEAWFFGINTTHRSESAPSSPWGPRFFARSTDSEIIVNGGKLLAREGLRISTSDARRPGALRLRGKATLTGRRNSKFGIDVWCGIWEIEGGEVKISVGDIEFWGNKFEGATDGNTKRPVGPGLAVLKLTGDGVSTIQARSADFVDAAVLDVSSLNVSQGTYKVIDAEVIRKTELRFAEGTDTTKWSLRVDRESGDLFVTFTR